MTLKTVIEELPRLTLDERNSIITALKALGGNTSIAETKSSSEDFILDCIVELMRKEGLEFRSVAALRKSLHYRSFHDKAIMLEREWLPRIGSTRQIQQALLKLAISLLLTSLREQGLPVGAAQLMQQVHRLPVFIEAAYPGYLKMGLLSMVIKAGV